MDICGNSNYDYCFADTFCLHQTQAKVREENNCINHHIERETFNTFSTLHIRYVIRVLIWFVITVWLLLCGTMDMIRVRI